MIRSSPKSKELVALRILLKVLAWCVLGIAIVLSIFYTPTSIFLMVVYVMSVLIIFAILYALAAIVEELSK